MLKVENLNVFYGAIHAVRDISFKVPEGNNYAYRVKRRR